GIQIGDAITIDEYFMNALIFGDRILRRRCNDLRARLLEILLRHPRIEPTQCSKQARTNEYLIPGLTFTGTGSNVITTHVQPTVFPELPQYPCFPISLRETRLHTHHHQHPYLHISRSLSPLYPASSSDYTQVQPHPIPGNSSKRLLQNFFRVVNSKLARHQPRQERITSCPERSIFQ